MRATRASLIAAALCAALAAGAARAAELGTLFYSPAEREQLDRMRRGESIEAAPAAAAGARAITGFVQRSDGRGTVWIDGRPVRVAGPKAAPVFDPRAVRAYSKSAEEVKVERAPGH